MSKISKSTGTENKGWENVVVGEREWRLLTGMRFLSEMRKCSKTDVL